MTNQFCSVEVGDFIRAYHKGIHKVTKIERRFKPIEPYIGSQCSKDEYSSLVHYVTIIDGNMNIKKKPGKEQCCDARFCKLVNPADLYGEGLSLKNKYDKVGTYLYEELMKK